MKIMSTIGPPGTGKSTHLTKTITELATSTPNMCVCSFTRVAAGVLTSRINAKSIRYVGTLHALAFKTLGLNKNAVADDTVFAEWYGCDLENARMALMVYRYSRHHKVGFPEAFSAILPIIPYTQVEHLILSYLNWKSTYRYVDFDDMVQLATGMVEPFDVVVLDEAQDCTTEQWDFVRSFVKPGGIIYTGSDDDQALFSWAGGNTHAVAELSDEIHVLDQSYRIPKSVHSLAEATVQQISKRIPKVYKPTTHEGTIQNPQTYEPMWYPHKHTVLFRDKWALKVVEDTIIDRGIPYTKTGTKRGVFESGRCMLAKALVLEDYPTVKRLSKYLLPEYREDPIKACNVGWQKSLDFGTYYKETNYINLVDLVADPLICLSTIHGFKGEEDNHVVLMADCTTRVDEAMNSTDTYDDELRVWYVGLSRCRESLTIVGWNQFINMKGLSNENT